MTNRRVFTAPRPQETARVPAEAIDDARRGQRAARMLALPPAAVRT